MLNIGVKKQVLSLLIEIEKYVECCNLMDNFCDTVFILMWDRLPQDDKEYFIEYYEQRIRAIKSN